MTSNLKTYSEAHAFLPSDAKWSSSFGNPGEAGYCEYYRSQGERFLIENSCSDDTWSIKKVEA
jgi:hypothetical protein